MNLFCTAFDCLIRTCEFHKCHLTKRIRKFDWVNKKEGCRYYKSRNSWKTFYKPPERDDDYEDEEL